MPVRLSRWFSLRFPAHLQSKFFALLAALATRTLAIQAYCWLGSLSQNADFHHVGGARGMRQQSGLYEVVLCFNQLHILCGCFWQVAKASHREFADYSSN